MNYFLKKHKLVAWVILLTFLFTSVMPTNFVAGNSVASAADEENPLVKTAEQNGMHLTKTADPQNDGTIKLTLEAFADGSQSSKAKPLDIVLLLDVSGSMEEKMTYYTYTRTNNTVTTNQYVKDGNSYYQIRYNYNARKYYYTRNGQDIYVNNTTTRYTRSSTTSANTKMQDLHNAVGNFIDQVKAKDAAARSADVSFAGHRISIIKFAEDDVKNTIGNDSSYWGGYNYTQIVSDFRQINTNSNYLKSVVNTFSGDGDTASDKGMELAAKVVNGNPDSPSLGGARPAGVADTVIIMFTDGVPNHGGNPIDMNVANSAILTANTLKDKATIYTIGIFGDDVDTRVFSYMEGVASSADKFFKVETEGGLDAVFNALVNELNTVDLDATSVMVDEAEQYFDLPENATDIKIYTANYTYDASKTARQSFGERTQVYPAEGATITPSISPDGKLTVTGFNYKEHWCGEGASSGQKIIVEFTITPNGTVPAVPATGDTLPVNTNNPNAFIAASATADATITVASPQVNAYKYTTKYVDEEGNEIAGADYAMAIQNTNVTVDATRKTGIPSGYQFAATVNGTAQQTTQTQKITDATTEFTFVYQKVYTVTYKDGVNEAAFTDDVHAAIAKNSSVPEYMQGTAGYVEGTKPSRSGYDFNGWKWYAATDLNTEITKPESVTTDLVVIAQWTEQSIPNLPGSLVINGKKIWLDDSQTTRPANGITVNLKGKATDGEDLTFTTNVVADSVDDNEWPFTITVPADSKLDLTKPLTLEEGTVAGYTQTTTVSPAIHLPEANGWEPQNDCSTFDKAFDGKIVVAKGGNTYRVWSEEPLSTPERLAVIDAVNKQNKNPSFRNKLSLNGTKWFNGFRVKLDGMTVYPAQRDEEGKVITPGYVEFENKSNWSTFIYGDFTRQSITSCSLTNEIKRVENVKIVKEDNAHNPLGGAGFTVNGKQLTATAPVQGTVRALVSALAEELLPGNSPAVENEFVIGTLTYGTNYVIVENTVPNGYNGVSTFTVIVNASGQLEVVGSAQGVSISGTTITVANTLKTVNAVTIKKVDQDGNDLSNAGFKSNNNALALKAGSTNEFVLGTLSYGTNYAIEESTVPTGYNGVDSFTVTVNADGQIAFVLGAGESAPSGVTIDNTNKVITVANTKRTDLSYTVNYYLINTDNAPYKVYDSKTVENQTFGASVTETALATKTDFTVVNSGNYQSTQTITIGVEGNVINFYYYKNVELEANTNTVDYNGQEQSVNGFSIVGNQIEGYPANFSRVNVSASGTDATRGEMVYPAEFAQGIVGSLDATGRYLVTNATNGWLKINPLKATLTSATDEKQYDGTPLENHNVEKAGFIQGEEPECYVTGTITNEGRVPNDFTYEGEMQQAARIMLLAENENAVRGFNPNNYDIEKVYGTLTITANEEAAYQLSFHYFNADGTEDPNLTTTGAIHFVPTGSKVKLSETGKTPVDPDYTFNADLSAEAVAGKVVDGTKDAPTILDVYFDYTAKELYKVVFNYVDESGNVSEITSSGYVYEFEAAPVAPPVVSEESFDGTWYTSAAMVAGQTWTFGKSFKDAGALVTEDRVLNLYTGAKVKPMDGNIKIAKIVDIAKGATNAPAVGTVFEYNVHMEVTTSGAATAASATAVNAVKTRQEMAKVALEKAQDSYDNTVAERDAYKETILDNGYQVTSGSVYTFLAYYDFGERPEDEEVQEGECFGKWAIWGITSGSGYGFQLGERDQMFSIENYKKVTTTSMMDFVVSTIDQLEDRTYSYNAFFTNLLNLLDEKLAQPSTTGSALAFDADAAYGYYLSSNTAAAKAVALEAAQGEKDAADKAVAELVYADPNVVVKMGDEVLSVNWTKENGKLVADITDLKLVYGGQMQLALQVDVTSGSALTYYVEEVSTGGADSTDIREATTNMNVKGTKSNVVTLTSGSEYSFTFTNHYTQVKPTPDPEPVPPTPTPTPDPDPVKPEPTPEEPIDDPQVPTGEPDEDVEIEEPEVPLGAPQTGDAANAAGMMALLALAAAGLATTRRKFN